MGAVRTIVGRERAGMDHVEGWGGWSTAGLYEGPSLLVL